MFPCRSINNTNLFVLSCCIDILEVGFEISLLLSKTISVQTTSSKASPVNWAFVWLLRTSESDLHEILTNKCHSFSFTSGLLASSNEQLLNDRTWRKSQYGAHRWWYYAAGWKKIGTGKLFSIAGQNFPGWICCSLAAQTNLFFKIWQFGMFGVAFWLLVTPC